MVGTVGDADKAREAIDALLQAGFHREDIDILHGEEDLHRLDPTGAEHGFLAQFQRTVIRTFDLEEFKHLTHHVEDVRAGRCVIMVLTKRREQRIVAADILHQLRRRVRGVLRPMGVGGSAGKPARDAGGSSRTMFARAWNARDPDALASLFDGDAEFVNVTGRVLARPRVHPKGARGRGCSGRRKSTAGDRARRTSSCCHPTVAVVHARMTLSGQAPAVAVTQAGPRTTIVSFVVHRVGERWLCASAHHTDVIPNVETNAIG